MANIYDLENDRSFLLYTNQNQILMRQKSGDMIGRSTLLAKDYSKHLSSFYTNGILYYSYITVHNEIIIRSSRDSLPLFHTENIDHHTYGQPQISLFGNQLFLLYSCQNPQSSSHSINLLRPLQKNKPIPIPYTFPTQPDIQTMSTRNFLYISICSDFSHKILCLDSSYQLTELFTSDTLQKAQQQLTEKNKSEVMEVRKQLENASSTIANQNRQIQKLNQIIESAQNQYNNLMQVASQYKDEALKWRSKFYKP